MIRLRTLTTEYWVVVLLQRGDCMSKKKWKKKYKKLKNEYENLYCDYISLKLKDMQILTDEESDNIRNTFRKMGERLAEASENVFINH